MIIDDTNDISGHIFSDTDIWDRGVDLNRVPHEHLQEEMYYEQHSVGTGARSNYSCEHCGKNIPKGEPHANHKFYGDGDWPSYRTHHKCSDKFKKSLRVPSDGES